MRAVTHPETETTFDVPDDLAIPDLTVVEGIGDVAAPIVQDLDAEYFDTADLSLLAAHIGLRRRQGGEGAGWHVKIQRATGERIEVRQPLDGTRGRPPTELVDLVVAHSRRAPLAPVARVRTHRTVYRLLDDGGRPLAEVADDAVVAEVPGRAPTSWREVEVELVAGDDDLLDAVGSELRAHGAQPAEATSKLARVLDGQLPAPAPVVSAGGSPSAGAIVTRYLQEQTKALVDVDPAVRVDAEDAVHKMRVATRRLRSALRKAVDAQPPALVVGPVGARIGTSMAARHDAAHRRALRELSSVRYTNLLAALDHLADAIGGRQADKPARKVLVAEIRRAHRRMRGRLDDALAASSADVDDRLHEVRKAAKRVRYAADSASVVLGAKADKLASRMESAQEMLGIYQDTVVTRGVLRWLAREADADGQSTFTYGRLHAIEQQRGAEARAAFLDAVDDGWARRPRWLR
jgi:CHAD domain-containing protein